MKDKLLAPGFELWTAGVERLLTLYVQTRVNVAANLIWFDQNIWQQKSQITFFWPTVKKLCG